MGSDSLDESLRRRLESLNRGALPVPPRQSHSDQVVAAPRERRSLTPAKAASRRGDLLPRAQVTSTRSGEHLTIALPVAEFWPHGDQLIAARHEHLAAQGPGSDEDRQRFVEAVPRRFVGLDLETCGLSGSALFLVGLVRQVEERYVVELLFARNYAEESAVLESLGERLAQVDSLVTFNGKSFDWPMVTDRWHRYLLHRTQPLPQLSHFDVLHHARRRWRKTLPDCKLQTIERMICRRSRTGDIAGHLIPGAYDHYVQTGVTSEMEQVLYHNAMDLVTMLDVAMRLAGD